MMNFCVYPQSVFPQLGITAVVVPGYEIGDVGTEDARFIDNRRIEGTLAEMVEETVAFCKRNMKVKTIIDAETGKRMDKLEYPVKAIREAVLNAVIHRDYSEHTEGTPIQVNMFQDRIEIHSPGNLYGRMTVEQLGVSRPDLRNPALAVMAESLTAAENRYSGIPTIRREMYSSGLKEPVFENRRNEFVVTLYNDTNVEESIHKEVGEKKKEKDISEKILAFCKEPRLRGEIAELLNIKTEFYVMDRYITPLLKEGKLDMTIPEKPKSKYQRYYTSNGK